jgi:hypothetical protein
VHKEKPKGIPLCLHLRRPSRPGGLAARTGYKCDLHKSSLADLTWVVDLGNLHCQIGILSLQFVLSRKDAAPDRVTLGMSNAEDFDVYQAANPLLLLA